MSKSMGYRVIRLDDCLKYALTQPYELIHKPFVYEYEIYFSAHGYCMPLSPERVFSDYRSVIMSVLDFEEQMLWMINRTGPIWG